MTTQRISVSLLTLSKSIHNRLTADGISTVRVLQSINAYLGKLDCVKSGEASLGQAKIVGKGVTFQQSENLGTAKFQGTLDVVGEFKAYNDGLAKLEKQFGEFALESLPVKFDAWLEKHAPESTKQDETPAKRNGKVPA